MAASNSVDFRDFAFGSFDVNQRENHELAAIQQPVFHVLLKIWSKGT
jgi:hypothetical protein